MKTVALVCRILLGLIFVVFGLNGFLNFIPGPLPGGAAGAFLGAMISSHYVWLIAGTQIISGLLLLSNRYLTLGIALFAPILANIITFHLTMLPMGLGMAIGVTILWVILAWKHRASFSQLFAK